MLIHDFVIRATFFALYDRCLDLFISIPSVLPYEL